MEISKPNLAVNASQESILTWANRPYIQGYLREQLQDANALIVPAEGYAYRADLVYFPAGTVELLQFLKESDSEYLKVDICIEDDNYKEVALHADLLIIAGLVVTTFVAPLIVELVAAYVVQRRDKGETVVKSTLIIYDETNGRSVSFSYEGSAEEYRDVMLAAIHNPVYFQEQPLLDSESPERQQAPKNKKRKKRKKR